jgi:CheY-like chemotaxis protein
LIAASVLVVEDNPVMGHVVRFNLERAGLRVDLAKDGVEAVERLRGAERYQLVVTDYQMPRLDGAGVCRMMRGEEALKDVPVLFVSAKGMELDLNHLRDELGVIDVIYKPFSPTALVERVRGIVERHRRPAFWAAT